MMKANSSAKAEAKKAGGPQEVGADPAQVVQLLPLQLPVVSTKKRLVEVER
jgi:hypothetical protein